MAHHVEPMDVDCMDSDFDDKENTYHHSNVLPCTEKGYEELDVSELNMKLRYSMTPVSSPMSKSYTATLDNRNMDNEDLLNSNNENHSLTRSLNSTITKSDSAMKSLKSLPLQSLPKEQFMDGNGNTSVLRQLDTTITGDSSITVTVSETNDIGENLSLPSTSSSALHTPEATTPTKEMTKDGGSPIIRGLKSVLNMFRSSQSPIPSLEGDNIEVKPEVLSPADVSTNENLPQAVASTPIAAHRAKDGNTSKTNSPYKDSIVFNDDLEKELNWTDETTIIFSHEKIPVQKLFFQNTKAIPGDKPAEAGIHVQDSNVEGHVNATVEYMDVSCDDSLIKEKPILESHEVSFAVESDSEFVDCETTFSKNDSQILERQGTEGKHFLQAASVQDPDMTKDISLKKDNSCMENPPVLYYDITGVSFTEGECKNDVTEPSDYSDYSKETNEILSELDKLEENVTCKVDLKHEICYTQNNIVEEEVVMEKEIGTATTTTNLISKNDSQEQKNETVKEMDNPEIESTIPENDKQEQNIITMEEYDKPEIETTESQTQELNVTIVKKQDENTPPEEQNNITQAIELKTLDAPEIQTEANQEMEALIVSDDIGIHSDDTVQITHDDNGNITHFVSEASADDSTIDFNTHQDVRQLIQNQDNSNLSLVGDVAMNPNLQTIEVDQIKLETNFGQDSDKTQVIQMSQLATEAPMVIPTSSEQETVALELSNVELQKKISEVLNISLTQMIVDGVLPDEERPKETFEIKPTKILNETQNVFGPNTVSAVQIEKPSDIPLPDEDDIDNEGINAEVPDTTPTEIAPVIHSEIDIIETIKKQSDSVVEDKIENDTTRQEDLNRTSPEPAVVQLAEGLETANTEFKLDVAEISATRPLELEHSNIGNETVLPEHGNNNIMSIETETHLPSNALEFTTEICKTNVTENKESFPKVVLETEVSNLVPEDALPSNSNVPCSQTYEHVPNDLSEMVNDSQFIRNTIHDTVTPGNFEQDQNKTHDMDMPMDITINESLNQTHDLSNLMNQTVIMTDENLQTVTPTNLTVETPKREELGNHSQTVETSNDVETQLKMKALATEDINNDVSDFKISSNPVNLTPQKDEPIDVVSQSVNTYLPTPNDNKSDFVLENNSASKPYVKSSDHELTETIGNTVNNENKEVEITTVEDEIIVSENNSPYVSLMAGVETLLEKTDETFENMQNPFVTNANIPSSPPITSRGYNFNFDEMDDPFATTTKIRLSPPLDTPSKIVEQEHDKTKPFEPVPKRGIGNRRKSQPVERKKASTKKKFNNTFDDNSASKQPANKIEAIIEATKNKHLSNTEVKRETEQAKEAELAAFDAIPLLQEDLYCKSEALVENTVNKPENTLETSMENKTSNDSIVSVSNNIKTTSSSELSTYYSAGTSSTDSLKSSKNVFNIPEIDDVNFNPFATKSKMRQSPPPDPEVENPFATITKISTRETSMSVSSQLDANSTVTIDESKLAQLVRKVDPEDKVETELMEKETSNLSNTTSSSKASDHLNLTTREIHTEDEDTIEGPFLETEDVIDKMSDIDADNVDMMQFNDVPVQGVEDNAEEGELFIDAEAFEFLLNKNTNVVADSGKESLFLKFDPLFAKRMSSAGVFEALSKIQKRESTPKKPVRPSLRSDEAPVAGPSILNATYESGTNVSQETNEDANINVSKPMMVVTPAVNPVVTSRNKSITPTRSNRRSVTFTSPAIAVIDRLLSMSANNSFLGQDTTITQTHREQTEADLALTQLRELLAEKEISVYSLRSESKELKDRLSIMESQVRILEADGQGRLKKINELNERLTEKTKINKSMAAVVEEYERTIASLIAETEQDKKRNAEERIRLINERDEQTAHLASMEVSFSDLHSKYEKSKQVILACKSNEEIYKKSIKDFEENLTKMQTNYEMLKQHATSKLNHANQELEKLNRAHESEVVKLHAMIKRKDLHITSLEETLAQKTKANEELTAICDELINKVG